MKPKANNKCQYVENPIYLVSPIGKGGNREYSKKNEQNPQGRNKWLAFSHIPSKANFAASKQI